MGLTKWTRLKHHRCRRNLIDIWFNTVLNSLLKAAAFLLVVGETACWYCCWEERDLLSSWGNLVAPAGSGVSEVYSMETLHYISW